MITFLSLILVLLPQDTPTDKGLEVELSILTEKPIILDPVKLKVTIHNRSDATVRLTAGLMHNGAAVWIAHEGGEFTKLSRGSDPIGTIVGKDLLPTQSFVRADIITHSARTLRPAFDVPGKYRLKVSVEGHTSTEVPLVIGDLPNGELAAAEFIRKHNLFSRFGPLRPRSESFRSSVVERLEEFLNSYPASRFRAAASFGLAWYLLADDLKLAAEESAVETGRRRGRITGLLGDADSPSMSSFRTEIALCKGIVCEHLGWGRSALQNLTDVLSKDPSTPILMETARRYLSQLEKAERTSDKRIDWSK